SLRCGRAAKLVALATSMFALLTFALEDEGSIEKLGVPERDLHLRTMHTRFPDLHLHLPIVYLQAQARNLEVQGRNMHLRAWNLKLLTRNIEVPGRSPALSLMKSPQFCWANRRIADLTTR